MTSEQRSHREVLEATATAEATMRLQSVPVNVYETTQALVVVAPVPAVTPDDVTVETRPGRLRFFAHLRSAGTRQYLIHEWDYGGYEREIEIPAAYAGGLEATLAHGQLAIRVLRGDGVPAATVKPTPGN